LLSGYIFFQSAPEYGSNVQVVTRVPAGDVGLLRQVSYSDGTPSISYAHDRLGRLDNVIADGVTTSFTYNLSGQVLTESYSGGALSGKTISKTYLNGILPTAVSLNSPSTVVSYAYDGASRMTNVVSGAYSAGYSYAPGSRLVEQINARSSTNLLVQRKQYDFNNRLTGISATPANGTQLPWSFRYVYNDASQRIRSDLADGSYWIYDYDSLGQVKSGKRFWSDGTAVAGQQFEYGFDNIGNRTVAKAGGDETGSASALRTTSYAVNSLNQYTSRGNPNPAKVDIIGLASPTATVSVNSDSSLVTRKRQYFHKELGVTAYTYPSIAVSAAENGVTTNFPSGKLFIPPTLRPINITTTATLSRMVGDSILGTGKTASSRWRPSARLRPAPNDAWTLSMTSAGAVFGKRKLISKLRAFWPNESTFTTGGTCSQNWTQVAILCGPIFGVSTSWA
jgi:hypothetical protein